MIEINLAPGAESRRTAGRRRTAVSLPRLPALGTSARGIGLGALGVLLLGLVALLFARQSQRRAELEERVAREVADSTRLATTIALVNSLRARQDTIEQKIGVIREVDQRRYVWPHLLDEVSTAVPQFTWLTQVSSSADTTSALPALTLQGNAGSTQALTRFMKNLEASPFIRDVTLVTSQQQPVEGRTIHRFTLEARYEAPDSAVIQTVPIVVLTENGPPS